MSRQSTVETVDRLARFLEGQQDVYVEALTELRAGRKRSHWMWFIFPQLKGLRSSATSILYGLDSIGEARLYLGHDVLGARLCECTAALLSHRGQSAEAMLGGVDAMKLRSSMTLFDRAGGGPDLFGQCLGAFFGGEPDPATLRLIDRSS